MDTDIIENPIGSRNRKRKKAKLKDYVYPTLHLRPEKETVPRSTANSNKNDEELEVFKEVMTNNSFLAHSEMVLYGAVLGDNKTEKRHQREKGKEGIWARHLYKYVIYIRQLDKATHICYMSKAPSLLLRPLQY